MRHPPHARAVAKGGDAADIGLPQRREHGDELPLVTSGDDLASIITLARGSEDYTAADVIEHLLAKPTPPPHAA